MVFLYLTEELTEDATAKTLKGMTAAVSGSGNVAIYAIRESTAARCKSCNMLSDSTGWVYDPEGIDVAALKEIKEVKRARLTEYTEISSELRIS